MKRLPKGPIIGVLVLGTVSTLALLGGCPTGTTTPPSTETGVTAKQVNDLIADLFGAVDRDLTLWDIQPGLGTVMIEYGRRFALMQLAAQAGDWGMAQYQLKEAMEIQEVGEVTRPSNADALVAFEQSFLEPLEDDILNKDLDSFNQHVTSAIDGCNACHVATGKPFVVIRAPVASPEDFLFFEASDPVPPESSESESSSGTTADDQTPLTWEELTQMVDDAFNMVNRDLALWNIQPGLGTVMMEYGRRFAMLKSAVDAASWGMAQYQLKEAIEIQEVGEVTRPSKADLLSSFEASFLDPLEAAIEAKDADAFNAAYDAAIDGCNACHVGTGHPYIRVTTPPTLAEPFLSLSPSDPAGPEEEESETTTPPADNFPPGMPTLADAEAMIRDRLNTLDRTLELWNIQPGLGTVMMEYGLRFALAKLAAEAGNWGMADYQIDEAIEIQEVGETTRPNNAALLADFEQNSLTPLQNAIEAQDLDQFESAYQSAMSACNACHVATGHPYIVVQDPPANLVDYLDLEAGGM